MNLLVALACGVYRLIPANTPSSVMHVVPSLQLGVRTVPGVVPPIGRIAAVGSGRSDRVGRNGSGESERADRIGWIESGGSERADWIGRTGERADRIERIGSERCVYVYRIGRRITDETRQVGKGHTEAWRGGELDVRKSTAPPARISAANTKREASPQASAPGCVKKRCLLITRLRITRDVSSRSWFLHVRCVFNFNVFLKFELLTIRSIPGNLRLFGWAGLPIYSQ